MKKQLKGIDEKTVVHCPTKEIANQVLQIAHDAGYRWCTGESYLNLIEHNCYGDQTSYHIGRGEYASKSFYKEKGLKILSAKEFIEMNTPQQSFNLETYTPKRQLEGFPKEVIKRMLECQVEQGNKEDVVAFEFCNSYDLSGGGFDWNKTKEGTNFWIKVLSKNFNIFFEKYPKQEQQMNNKTKSYSVTREALAEVYNMVCDEWKREIMDICTKSPLSKNLYIPTPLVQEAWKQAEPKHKEWLTKNGLELPKKKVTKTVRGWVNIYPDKDISKLYNTKELADRGAAKNRLDCVKIIIPYQVEE